MIEWILVNGEDLQFAVFFGALLVFGMLEARAPAQTSARVQTARRLRWTHNFTLTALNIVALGALPLSGLIAAAYADSRSIGLLNEYATPAWLALLATLLARSFVSYIIHLCNHHIPLLWRFHRVHHSDPVLDISTTVRFHPAELAVSALPVLATIVALGLPAWALLVYEILDAGVNVFTHANVRLPDRLNRLLCYVFVTPAMHRVHHSSRMLETNSNFGAVFSFWDRLCGTYVSRTPSELAELPIGLEYWDEDWRQSFWWLLGSPVWTPVAKSGPLVDRKVSL
ncbi:MAG: sterol desaturase family protein [bacterium]|nr:sterol desaturase family protein [bacterium]